MHEGLDKMNPARRHFFHVIRALDGAAVLTAVPAQARAQDKGRSTDFPGNGPSGGSRCMLLGTRVLSERVESLSVGDRVVTTCGEGRSSDRAPAFHSRAVIAVA